MHGVGVVSLAGIVVNNNIILIDAFNFVREKDNDNLFNSILKACAQRLRPIFPHNDYNHAWPNSSCNEL